jgi:hypothetical protein
MTDQHDGQPEIDDDRGIPDPEIPNWTVLKAFAEAAQLAAAGQELPPGLDTRITDDGAWVELQSRGKVIARVDRPSMLARAREIASTKQGDGA